MKGILIVDDQEDIRYQIIKMLKEMQLDFGPLFQASDGDGALKVIHNRKPEIALIDIIMPGTNGLELIEQIRKTSHNTHIVIISSYNDFEFMKKAIVFKVDEYILKPVSQKELYGIMISLVGNIKKEGESASVFEEKEYQYYKMLLFEYMTGSDIFINIERVQEGLKVLALSAFCFRVVKINLHGNCPDAVTLFSKRFNTILADKSVTYVVIENNSRDMVYLMNYTGSKCELTDFTIKHTLESVSESAGLKCNCGISNEMNGLHSLGELYKQADYALKESILKGSLICIFSDIRDSSRFFLRVDEMSKLLTAIKLSNMPDLEKHMDYIFTRMTKERVAKADVENSLSCLINYLVLNLKDQCPGLDEIHRSVEDIRKEKDIFNLKINVKNLISHIYYQVNENRQKNNSTYLTDSIINYIHNNYQKDISLSFVANELNMNYYYISALFSKKTGMPFSEYLFKVRFDKAKELLAKTSLKVYEVAVNSGFNDSQYFCNAFKRQFSITPMQYRKNAQRSFQIS